MSLDILVTRGVNVSKQRVYDAVDALNDWKDDISERHTASINIYYDFTEISGVNCSERSLTIDDVETNLYNEGFLTSYDMILFIYSCSGTDQDGTMYTAGHSWYEFGLDRGREYPSEGQYSISMANAATAKWPYNVDYFKNTCIHEIGHNLMAEGSAKAEHKTGKIKFDDRASPMCTWYVEADESAYVSNYDIEDEVCTKNGDWNNTGHAQEMAYCAENIQGDYIEARKSEGKI